MDDDASSQIQPDAHAFDAVVGHGALMERIEQQVRGCAVLGRPFPHVLFSEPAGTGKDQGDVEGTLKETPPSGRRESMGTALAEAIARRLGARLVRKNGQDLSDAAALLRLLASLGEGDVLFVDEIHRVPRGVLEILCQAMDEQRSSRTFQQDTVENPVGLTGAPFTLLAVTTQPAKLPRPLRLRMGLSEHLRRYEAQDAEAEDPTPLVRQTGQEDAPTGSPGAGPLTGAPFDSLRSLKVSATRSRPIPLRGVHGRRTRDGRPLDFKGFAARHTCGRSRLTPGVVPLGSGRAD